MILKPLLVLALLAAALGVAACGEDESETKTGAATTASPATALRELRATRSGLQAAQASYRAGDRARAGEQVSTAYVEHFEHVEGPLEERDHELTESLEDRIREDLRREIAAGRTAQVERLFRDVFRDLTRAEALLR